MARSWTGWKRSATKNTASDRSRTRCRSRIYRTVRTKKLTGDKPCEELYSTVRATCVSRSATRRRSSSRRMLSSGSRPRACAGSDLWPYRGISPVPEPAPMGHGYCGIVEEVGSAVTSVKPGQFLIGSFFASDNTSPHCQSGYQSSCQHREFVGGAQAPVLSRATRGWHLGGHPGGSLGRADPEPAVGLRRLGHRLVRRRCGQGEARHDRRSRR
jgi:hypothetical protein